MKKSRVIISLLSLGLVGSNLWWAYQALDMGVTLTYLQDSFGGQSVMLNQTLSILPVAADPEASQAEVIAAAQLLDHHKPPREKEGFIWVGQLGLQFNDEGRLTKAVDGPQ